MFLPRIFIRVFCYFRVSVSSSCLSDVVLNCFIFLSAAYFDVFILSLQYMQTVHSVLTIYAEYWPLVCVFLPLGPVAYDISCWLVLTQDSVALSILLECQFPEGLANTLYY